MPTEKDIYDAMLRQFGDTLQETSKDDSDTKSPCFMTYCQKHVVNFDRFKNTRCKGLSCLPLSCDALHRYGNDMWFLVEFKNGTLEHNKASNFVPNNTLFYKIFRKILESLLLLTERLDKTVAFTRNNVVFILVYNEDKNNHLMDTSITVQESQGGRIELTDRLNKLEHRHDDLPLSNLADVLPPESGFNVAYFDALYVKKMLICSKAAFEKDIVRKYFS